MNGPVYTLEAAAKFLNLSSEQLERRLREGAGPRPLNYPKLETKQAKDALPVFHIADLNEYRATVATQVALSLRRPWHRGNAARN